MTKCDRCSSTNKVKNHKWCENCSELANEHKEYDGVNSLLTYVCTYYDGSSRDKVHLAVANFYSVDEIKIAKKLLWDRFESDLPKFESRRDSDNRSAKDMMVSDILGALDHLDNAKVEYSFVTRDIKRLPKFSPEETNVCSMVDRVVTVEMKCTEMDERQNVCGMEIDDMRKRMANFESLLKRHDRLLNNVSDEQGNDNVTPVQMDNHDDKVSPGVKQTASSAPSASGLSTGDTVELDNESSSSVRPRDNNTVASMSNNEELKQTFAGTLKEGAENGFSYSREYVRKLERDLKMAQTQKKTTGNEKHDIRARDSFHRPRQNKSGIITGQARGDSKIRGGPPPSRDFFVYNVHSDTSEEDMKDHLERRGVDVRLIEQASDDTKLYKSFHIEVSVKDMNVMRSPESWPFGIRVRKWNPPKNAST